MAHVLALLGRAKESLGYAERVLQYCQTNSCEDWDLAFAYLEMALASAKGGDTARHHQFHGLAAAQGAAIKDAEDRAVFLTEFARIPRA